MALAVFNHVTGPHRNRNRGTDCDQVEDYGELSPDCPGAMGVLRKSRLPVCSIQL